MIWKLPLVCAVIVLLLGTGCSGLSTQEQRALTGGALGAAGGAALGAVTGIGVLTGAVIGGGSGAVLGGLTQINKKD